jgi:hypothetical protein
MKILVCDVCGSRKEVHSWKSDYGRCLVEIDMCNKCKDLALSIAGKLVSPPDDQETWTPVDGETALSVVLFIFKLASEKVKMVYHIQENVELVITSDQLMNTMTVSPKPGYEYTNKDGGYSEIDLSDIPEVTKEMLLRGKLIIPQQQKKTVEEK